jgi:hypothetical protein
LELVKVPMDSSQSPPLNDQRHEGDVAPLVPKELPTAEEARSGEPARDPDAGRDSSDQCIGMAREGSDFSTRLPAVKPFPLMPKELPTAEEARSGEPARDPDAGHDSSDQCIGMAREGSDFSAGLGAVEPSIRVSPRPSDFKNDQVANDRPSIGRRTFRTLARFFIAALIGVGATFAWQSHGDEAKEIVRTWSPSLSSAWQSYGDEAKEMVRTWTPSLGWLASVSTTKSPPAPAPAAAATSPELVQQLEAMARDLTAVRHSVEQLADKQEQMARNIATLQTIEQDIRKKMSLPPPSQAVPIPPRKKAPRVAAPPQAATQSLSAPRPAPLRRPPLPMPP